MSTSLGSQGCSRAYSELEKMVKFDAFNEFFDAFNELFDAFNEFFS